MSLNKVCSDGVNYQRKPEKQLTPSGNIPCGFDSRIPQAETEYFLKNSDRKGGNAYSRTETNDADMREQFGGMPTSRDVIVIDGVSYTVVSHYTGKKDVDRVIREIAEKQAGTGRYERSGQKRRKNPGIKPPG